MPIRLTLFLIGLSFPVSLAFGDDVNEATQLLSPDGKLQLEFRLSAKGQPTISVSRREKPVCTGTLCLDFLGSGPLAEGLSIVDPH